MTTADAIGFADLRPEDFPFVLLATDDDTGEVLWQQEVAEPGVLRVPGFAPRKVNITMTTATYVSTSFWDGQQKTWRRIPSSGGEDA